MHQIRFLILIMFLIFFLNRNLLSSEVKGSCFTIYPNVLVRSTPSQNGKIVRKIEQSSLINIEDSTSEVTKIEIRNNFVEGNWIKISDGVKNYKLILRKNSQEMVIDSREKRYEMTSLIFVGDGELDFVFDLKDHYNVSNQHLYISSEKENDFFVVPVSANCTTGC